ncbi:hypothetical protein HYFRA_00003731 [Hymenoscyphus fraxineus]|uniref:Uncharacterized protein n=1 Tax=Hymenoscyphus fraxineus TaxID=746836 RepID=A0A9N9KXS6_9HELO|nr:hypothetical protein HYFRA_00003731 [Hymenoscyphus fraxineus]
MASNQLIGELLSELPAALAQHEDTFQLPQMSILPHDNPVEMDYTLTTYGGQPHYLTFPSSSQSSQINETPSGAPLNFWFFPTEIRELIFSFALFPAHPAKHGMHHVTAYSKHPLLVALRGDTQLYSEAIEVFYKLNTVFYTIDNYKDFCGPGELERVQKVKHLGVDLSFNYKEFQADNMLFIFGHGGISNSPHISKYLQFLLIRDRISWIHSRYRVSVNLPKPQHVDQLRQSLLLTAPSLETLSLNLHHESDGYWNAYLIVKEMANHCEKLRFVTLNFHKKGPWDSDQSRFDWWYLRYPNNVTRRMVDGLHHLAVQVTHLFGKRGVAARIINRETREYVVQWKWEAPQGKVLELNENVVDVDCKEFHDGECHYGKCGVDCPGKHGDKVVLKDFFY